MKKLYLALIIGILLITTIVAGGLTLSSINTASVTKASIDTLKVTNKISSLDVKATDIVCDKRFCKSWVSQEGLMNLEWITDAGSKTQGELIAERDKWISDKLTQYALIQKQRQDLK